MKLSNKILILLDEYLSELTKEPATVLLYKRTICLFITWLTKSDFPVAEPSRAAFVAYYTMLRKEGKSPRTIDLYVTSVRLFFKWMIRAEYYDRDITEGTKRLSRSSDYVRSPLSKEQLKALLTNLKADKSPSGLRDLAIINLMAFLGLRRNEVSLMNVEDIIQSDGDYYIKVQGKGRNEKDVMLPVTNEIINPIFDYWKIRPDAYTKESPAFVSHARCGITRLDPSFFSKLVKKHFRLIGLDDKLLTCHSLRHSSALLAMEAGASVLQVNQMLRQKNLTTTEQYLKGSRRGQIKDGTAIRLLNEYYQNFAKTSKKKEKTDKG